MLISALDVCVVCRNESFFFTHNDFITLVCTLYMYGIVIVKVFYSDYIFRIDVGHRQMFY